MSYYPIELDRERTFKYDMIAIDRIEKKFGKSVMQIEGLSNGTLSMKDYATIIHAGLLHEDKNLTPEQVMKLISEHSTIGKVTKVMWKAFNAQFATGDEEENKDEEEAKNE